MKGPALIVSLLMSGAALGTRAEPPEPPPMPKRAIAPADEAKHGETIELEDGADCPFTLFLPKGWAGAIEADPRVAVHFHCVPWFVIQEHVRRAARNPLLAFQLGEGSAVYQRAFEDTNRLGRVLRHVTGEMRRRGASEGFQIVADISSFSAGYGAVRELVKSPSSFERIDRIVLLDSMYAGYETEGGETAARRAAAGHIDPWMPFARAAIEGEKTFVLTYSAVETARYASTAECAAALAQRLGLMIKPVMPGSGPAGDDRDFPLRSRCDSGRFHLWGYGGKDAQAHLTHLRHMADVWAALERSRTGIPLPARKRLTSPTLNSPK